MVSYVVSSGYHKVYYVIVALFLSPCYQPVFPQATVEGGLRQTALFQRILKAQLPTLPCFNDFWKIVRRLHIGPSEPHAPLFRRRNAFRLPLADVGALVFRHKGQHLEHNVAEEGAHQVLAPPGIQQGHIQHYDVDAFIFRQDTPLILNFLVVASQPVDALDIE